MQSLPLASNGACSFSQIKGKQKIFIILLLVVSAIPFFLGPLLNSLYSTSDVAQQVFVAILLLGGSHQIASMYLYFDYDAKTVINKHKGYFYFGPVIIALTCAVIYTMDTEGVKNYFFVMYAMLTIFHYQKQNVGIYSLLVPIFGAGRMQPIERHLIMGGAFAGMIIFAWPLNRALFQGTILFPFKEGIELFSLLLSCLLTLFTLWFVFTKYFLVAREQRQCFRGMLLLGLVTFFWPMYLIDNKLTAFFMYATAHGLQYFVFICYAAVNGKKINGLLMSDYRKGRMVQYFNFIAFVSLSILLVYLWRKLGAVNPPAFLMLTESEAKSAVLGFSSSVTLIHYWVDSRIWKVRYEDSKAFVRSKFYFLGN